MMGRSLPLLPRENLIPGRDIDALPPLTIAVAPFGYGKSTLIRQWVRALPDDAAKRAHWIPLATTSSAQAFWRALAQALNTKGSDAEGAAEAWARNLSEPHALVIDSYENVSSPELDRQLIDLLSNAPNLRLVVAATRTAGLGRAAARAQILARELGVEDLQFTAADAAALARSIPDLADAARQAHSDFLGWPLGVRIALGAYTPEDAQKISWLLCEDLYAALTSPLERLFACAITACPDVGNEAIGAQVGLSPAQSAAVAQSLFDAGVVTVEGSLESPHYVPWPGVTPFLAEQAPQLWEAEKLNALIRQDALASAEKDVVSAIDRLIDTEQFEEANQIAAQRQGEVLRGGRPILVALRRVPLAELQKHTHLLLARVTLERPNPTFPAETVEDLVRRARPAAIANARRPLTDETLAGAAALMSVERMLGNWEEALTVAREICDYVEGRDGSDSTRAGESVHLARVAQTGMLAADFHLARKAGEAAVAAAVQQGALGLEQHGLSLLALTDLWGDDVAAAALRLKRVDAIEAQLAESARHRPELESLVERPGFLWVERELARITLNMWNGDPSLARGSLDRLLPLMDRMEQWPLVVLAESEFLYPVAGFHRAYKVLDERLAARPQWRQIAPAYLAAINARRATLAMGRGRFREARARLEEAGIEFSHYRVPLTRLELLEGNWEAAHAEASSGLADSPAPWHAVELSLARAVALLHGELEGDPWADVARAARILGEHDVVSLNTMIPYQDLHEIVKTWSAMEPGSPDAQRLRRLVTGIPKIRRVVRHEPLSPAELTTLNAMLGAPTTAQVAEALFLSPNTVKFHQRAIYRKLGVSSRQSALAKASQLGLLD